MLRMRLCLEALLIPAAVLIIGATETRADIRWAWSFATESGTFLTDGSVPCGTSAPAGTYAILDFAVTASTFPDNVGSLTGGEYSQNQPVQGFIWNGAEPTQWFRSSGAFTNGSNFFREGTGLRYLFAVDVYGIDDIIVDPGEFLVFSPAIDMASVVDPCPPTGRKVILCHKRRNTIGVGAPAAAAHLAHGDTLGPCP